MTTQDLQAALQRRQSGEHWDAIAKAVGMPESTLRGRLRAAGLISRKGTRGPRAVATTPAEATPRAAAAAVVAPQSSGTFVAPAWYPLLRYAMTSEKGATLFGPRGCGKSTAIRELAAEMHQSTVTLQCAANMQIDSLLGSWTSERGTLRFIDGPLTTSVRTGAWLLAEEANVIHPGVWSTVNTLTDQTGEGLRLPTGEVVAQSPEFRLVLIYNEGYAGTRDVNAALKDRLMPIFAGYLSAQEEVRVLSSQTGADAADCERVQAVASMIRAANLRFDLSPRSLTRWIRLVLVAGLTWEQAFERAILDLAGPPELAAPQRACLTEIARNNGVATWAAAPAAPKGDN